MQDDATAHLQMCRLCPNGGTTSRAQTAEYLPDYS